MPLPWTEPTADSAFPLCIHAWEPGGRKRLLDATQRAVAGPRWLFPSLESSQVPRAALHSYSLVFQPTEQNVPCPHRPNKAIGTWGGPRARLLICQQTIPSVKMFSWAKTPTQNLKIQLFFLPKLTSTPDERPCLEVLPSPAAYGLPFIDYL